MEHDKSQRLKKLGLIVLAVVVPSSLLLPIGIYFLVAPPPGPPLATLEIRSGQPFELHFVSNGAKPRLFVDMDCESCSLPLRGVVYLSADGKRIRTVEIEGGDRRDRGWGGTDRKLEQYLLWVGPVRPAGVKMSLSGKLLVGPARGNFSTAPIEGAPPPKVKVLRLTVAP